MKNVLIAFGVCVVLAMMVIVPKINNVPRLDETVIAAASEVDNQYKRRSDLIPNLVATVQGYAAHEKEVLMQVTEARAKVGQMTLTPEVLNNPQAFKAYQAAQDGLSSALTRLMAVSERYPELKASQNFLSLQAQLEGTENRIAVARRDYIETVKNYNLEIRTIPGRWIAAIFYPDAQIKQNFTATQAESAAPKVAF